eukprot:gnl/TRDRNA2_/TRDRNA2_59233_c0_seq1.p1 gnl/TRDRNA2_/TRDRNA2_59233_c0~~gnl/TRDRNA2_/TRDRNA2_59233_c0_seq1.p1  ORF type:complete len:154 (-),score=18.70 gnl/TRDRNA2_/TRDRNA2_59233_c0_seq1:367-783(-)
MWGLGPGESDEDVVAKALAKPDDYVLKPQREGGGNNWYGRDLAIKLKESSLQDRGAYILMRRIESRSQEAAMLIRGELVVGPTISEFGFFSVFLGQGGSTAPILNERIGFNVRTKFEGIDDGNVTKGFAVLSSSFLMT